MGHKATISPTDADKILVEVPATRPDILHECDLMEDAAIAYGFNKLPDTFPATNTVAQPLEISKLSDIVRTEWALAGWIEVLPLILVFNHVQSIHTRPEPFTFDSALMKRISNG
jgi:phenylalanyl-tRNA synthetase beta chain